MKKRIVSLLMAAMMTINTLPMNVFATTFGSVEETPAEIHEEIVEEGEGELLGEAGGSSNYIISIMGDSISTFDGYLPAGNKTFYPKHDVTTVEETW